MTNTKLLIKRSIKSFVSAAGIKAGFAAATADSVNIIAYHRVVKDLAKAEREAIYGLVVSARTFRRHCESLRKSFDVVSLETARQFLAGERKSERPLAVLTFDDGYLDFYEEAFPVLREFDLPATVFLPTEFIGQPKYLAHDRIYWLLKQAIENSVSMKNALIRAGLVNGIAEDYAKPRHLLKLTNFIVFLPNELREKIICEMERELGDKFESYPPEYRLLNWEMVREMAQNNIDFGGHTVNHVVLTLETEAAIRQELADGKKTLETHLGGAVSSFAYPNGQHNAEIRRMAAQAGYQIAVTTEAKINRRGADLFALGRTSLCEESTRGFSGVYSPRVADLRLGI